MGPGGIGKTSVALAVAEQAETSYEDGVYLVDCAPLLGTSLVARKLASTLGLDIAVDDPTRGLIAFLQRKQVLIVLDCCDRVLDRRAAGSRSTTCSRAFQGGVRILATSRETLRAEGESVVCASRLLEIPFPRRPS